MLQSVNQRIDAFVRSGHAAVLLHCAEQQQLPNQAISSGPAASKFVSHYLERRRCLAFLEPNVIIKGRICNKQAGSLTIALVEIYRDQPQLPRSQVEPLDIQGTCSVDELELRD